MSNDELQEKQKIVLQDLQYWFSTNGLVIDEKGVEQFVGIMNKQKLLYDIHMEQTKQILEDSLLKTIKSMYK